MERCSIFSQKHIANFLIKHIAVFALWLIFLVCTTLCLPVGAIAKNLAKWPYGAQVDSSSGWKKQLNFDKNADLHDLKFARKSDFFFSEFRGNTDFNNSEFSEESGFYESKFLGSVDFSSAIFSKASFRFSKFFKEADFRDTKFIGHADFWDGMFTDWANFSSANFKDKVDFVSSQFKEFADFEGTLFSNKANFNNSTFLWKADFRHSKFSEEATFQNSKFKGAAGFESSKFKGTADFWGATFAEDANFRGATFLQTIIVENVMFDKTVNFSGTKFEKGIDLRRSDLSKAKIYIDHNTSFPSGSLYVYWEQLHGRLYLNDSSCPRYGVWQVVNDRIKKLDSLQHHLPAHAAATRDSLQTLSRFTAQRDSLTILCNQDRYALTKIFYDRLRDNYLAQSDKTSADEVMYALAEKRVEYLGEFWWRLYGLIFGWGYRPMRFVLAVFLVPVLLFAVLWYLKYYHLVAPLVDDTVDDDQKHQAVFPSDYHNAGGYANLFARLWHVIFFSTSVLLSIKFRKEWIEKYDKVFLFWVTFEWAFGIILYIAFAALVKSHEFGYIKGLLGF